MSDRRVRPCTIVYHHRTQARDGQRVHIREIQDALRAQGHRVVEVAPVSSADRAGATARGPRARMLEAVVGAVPPFARDVLEWAYNAYAVVRLAAAVRRERPDFIYERHALNTIAGTVVARWFGLPLLLEVNSPLVSEQQTLGRPVCGPIARALERYALRGADRVLVVSTELQRIIQRTATLAPETVVVIKNGVDEARFDRARQRRNTVRMAHGLNGRLVIGATAFFLEWHGTDRLLRWLAARPALRNRVRILLVGDGPALPALRQQAIDSGIAELVTFTGDVDHHDVPELVAAMDVAVMGRATPYASPLKLFEYLACGLAIVAPRQDNIAEIVTDGSDALLFDEQGDTAFERVMDRIASDAPLRATLGARARATVSERGYSWSGNARRIVAAFESLPRPRRRGVGVPLDKPAVP